MADGPEIRIGLVLYGGVSLAVYIYGVVVEVQRLLAAAAELEEGKKESAYAQALDASGASAVTVDIVSGTSAGGINGILLAKALAAGSDVYAARDLWVDRGDIGQLLQPPSTRDPRSLLSSEAFEEAVLDGMEKLDRGSGAMPQAPVLDLFVSSTHLRGGRRVFTDELGREIHTRQHRYVFRLKLRRRQAELGVGQGYSKNDFEDNERLVRIARATSAFPVAFEPKLIPKSDRLFDNLEDGDGWFADGGILNNKPFTEAVEAILTRRSQVPVRRWLFSLDPDPKLLKAEHGPGEAPAFDQIALRSVTAIPRYQSIARDLVALRQHDEKVLASEEAIRAAEAQLSEFGDGAGPLGPGLAAGYRTLRRQAWAKEVADGLVRSAGLEGDDEETDRAEGPPDWGEVHRAYRVGAEGTAIERQFQHEGLEWEPDLAFQRRRIYYLIKLLSMAAEVEGADPVQMRRELWAEFEELSDAIWELFVQVPVDPDPVPFGARVAEARTVLEAELGTLSNRERASEDRLRSTLSGAEIEIAYEGRRFRVPLEAVFEDFERRDAILLPAALYGDLDRRDRVNHAQISPLNAENTGVDPKSKLAGDSLGHFGGFLDPGWRRNDVMWGRLDGAEILIKAILAEQGQARLGQLADDVQVEVLGQELPEVLEGPGPWKRALQDHMGGGPALGDLDRGSLVSLGFRAARVLRAMLKAAARDALGGGFFNRARAFVLRAGANVIGYAMALVYLPATAFYGKAGWIRKTATAALLAPLLWGVLTLVLGLLGAFDLDDVKYAVAIAIGVYPALVLAWWLLGPVRRLVVRLRRWIKGRR